MQPDLQLVQVTINNRAKNSLIDSQLQDRLKHIHHTYSLAK